MGTFAGLEQVYLAMFLAKGYFDSIALIARLRSWNA
jgi:hypothetical protein